MSQNSNLFLFIGKPIKDEYGRSAGKIVTFATTPNGKFDAAFIEMSDGRFAKYTMDCLSFNGNEVTLISKIKSKASIYYDQIPFIWRKDQALKDLADKKKISQDLYKELHNNFSTVLSQLRKEAQILLDEASQGITGCEEALTALSYGVLHLELEHEIGKISDDVYKSSSTLLQENIKHTTAEKNDMEAVKSKLSNILLGDTPVVPTPAIPEQKSKVYVDAVVETPELPEPPVVVYVKEVGKAGI